MTPEINLMAEGDASQNRISISESPDLLVQNKSVITTTLKMNYSYTYTSPEGYPYHRRFEGTFTNDRTVFRDKRWKYTRGMVRSGKVEICYNFEMIEMKMRKLLYLVLGASCLLSALYRS